MPYTILDLRGLPLYEQLRVLCFLWYYGAYYRHRDN